MDVCRRKGVEGGVGIYWGRYVCLFGFFPFFCGGISLLISHLHRGDFFGIFGIFGWMDGKNQIDMTDRMGISSLVSLDFVRVGYHFLGNRFVRSSSFGYIWMGFIACFFGKSFSSDTPFWPRMDGIFPLFFGHCAI